MGKILSRLPCSNFCKYLPCFRKKKWRKYQRLNDELQRQRTPSFVEDFEFGDGTNNDANGNKLKPGDEIFFVPYREPVTVDQVKDRKQTIIEWIKMHKLCFPRSAKMEIDGSYHGSVEVENILTSCPIEKIDIEFRYLNFCKIDLSKFSSFLGKVKHLKLRACFVNCSVLRAIVENGEKLVSLRIVEPQMDSNEYKAFRLFTNPGAISRPDLKTLTFVAAATKLNVDYLRILLKIYCNVENYKIHIKKDVFDRLEDLFGRTASIADNKISYDAIANDMTKLSKEIRAIDVSLRNVNEQNGHEILMVHVILYSHVFMNLQKIGIDFDSMPTPIFVQTLSTLKHLRAVKWSLHFDDSGSATYFICKKTMEIVKQLRSFKIVFCKIFTIDGALLDLILNSVLQKFHICADNILIDDGCKPSSILIENVTLHDLKLRVNNFSEQSTQFEEINVFMKLVIRLFIELKRLYCSPIRTSILKDILFNQKQLVELSVELNTRRVDEFDSNPRNKTQFVYSLSNFKNLKHLQIVNYEDELDPSIFSVINSNKVESLKLFASQRPEVNVGEIIATNFRKFPNLSCLQYNTELFIRCPLSEAPRRISFLEVENYLSHKYLAEKLRIYTEVGENVGCA